MSAPTVSTRLAQIAGGQQRVIRLDGVPLGSLAARPVLTNRMREYFTYGSVGGAGGNPGPYPAANAGGPRQFTIRTSLAGLVAQFWRSAIDAGYQRHDLSLHLGSTERICYGKSGARRV